MSLAVVQAKKNNALSNAFDSKRERLAKMLAGPLGGAVCIPESTLTSVKRKAGAGQKSGFHIMEAVPSPTPRLRYTASAKNMQNGHLGVLGKGNQGVVYIGYWGSSSLNNVMAIKIGDHEAVNREVRILNALKGVSPHIPRVYLHKTASQCSDEAKRRGGKNPLMNAITMKRFNNERKNGETGPVNARQSIMYFEYASGGPLGGFFNTFGPRLDEMDIKVIVFQVLWTLDQMHKKRPGIRHNDMIMDNILVDVDHHNSGTTRYKGGFTVPNRGYRTMISDFGLALSDRPGMKELAYPMEDMYGIGLRTVAQYDTHLFLMTFGGFIAKHPKSGEFLAWVRTVIPQKYNWIMGGHNAQYLTKDGRLKYSLGSDIPTPSQMLSTTYFVDFRKPKYNARGNWPRNAVAAPAPVRGARRVVSRPKPRRVVRSSFPRELAGVINNSGPQTATPSLAEHLAKAKKSAPTPESPTRVFNELKRNEILRRFIGPKVAAMRKRTATAKKFAKRLKNRAGKKMYDKLSAAEKKMVNGFKDANKKGLSFTERQKRVATLFRLVKSNKATKAQLAEFVNLVGTSNHLTKAQRQRLPEPKFLSDPKVLAAIAAEGKNAVRSKVNEIANVLGLNENETKNLMTQMAKKAPKMKLPPAPKGSKLPEPGANNDPGKFYRNWFTSIPKSDYKSVMSSLTVADLKYLAETIMSPSFKMKVGNKTAVKKRGKVQAESKTGKHKVRMLQHDTFNKAKKAELLAYFSSARLVNNILASNKELGINNNNKPVAKSPVRRAAPNENNELTASQKFFRSMNAVVLPKTKRIAPKKIEPKKLTKEQKAMYARIFREHEQYKEVLANRKKLDANVKKSVPRLPKKKVVVPRPKTKKGNAVSMMGEIAKMAKRDKELKAARDAMRRKERAAKSPVNADKLRRERQQRVKRIMRETNAYNALKSRNYDAIEQFLKNMNAPKKRWRNAVRAIGNAKKK